MEGKKRVPKRRFDGFTEEWGERILGDISEIKTGPFGSTLHASDYVESGIPIITTEHFKEGHLPTSKNEIPQVSDLDYSRLQSYVLQEGDIVFSRVGSVDINALVKEYQNGWLFSGRVLRVRPENHNDSEYLHHLLDTSKVRNNVISRAVGQTMPSINTEILKETRIDISMDIKEQRLIGEFLRNLDNTIFLQQRKLEKTKALKSAYLAEMFPAEGERVPKRRFAGFMDEWKETTLIDVIETFNNLRIPVTASKRVAGTTPYYGANGIQDYVEGYTHDGEFVLIAEDGANDLTDYPIHYVNGKVWVNNHAHVISGREYMADNHFLIPRIKSMDIKKWLVGGGRFKLNAEVLKEIQILIPNYEEQKTIGKFFKQLDNKITNEQHKLDKLKSLKQAYLNEMFV